MDNEQVGNLISTLRKEKQMTQKALADRLHVSDRAISKWECGNGCPDISILPMLCELLEVNAEQLLSGILPDRRKDQGNMRNMKFYVCPQCGNIFWVLQEGELSCCGRKLSALTVQEEDEAHQITVENIDSTWVVSMQHEMTKEHFISFAAYVTWDSIMIVKLYPEQDMMARFPYLRKGDIYVYCKGHGLYKKQLK